MTAPTKYWLTCLCQDNYENHCISDLFILIAERRSKRRRLNDDEEEEEKDREYVGKAEPASKGSKGTILTQLFGLIPS